MELTIKGTPKEIADLVVAIQGQQMSRKFKVNLDFQSVQKAIHGKRIANSQKEKDS